MFSKLFGRRSAAEPRQLILFWMTGAARWRKALEDVTAVDRAARRIAVVHFDDSLAALERDLHDADIAAARLDAEMIRTGAIPSAIDVLPILRSADLRNHAGPGAPVDGAFLFILAELWPSGERDEAVREFARALAGGNATIRQHVSLDDRVMARFAGDATRQLLKKLGMNEDEAIEHPMLADAIRRAQQKIASAASGDGPAANADDWFARYAPNT